MQSSISRANSLDMIILRILFLSLAIWIQDTVNAQQAAGSSCRTSNNTAGECIPLNKCNYITSNGHKPAAVQYVMKSKCDGDGRSQRFCCPLSSEVIIEKIAPDTKLCGQRVTLDDKIVGGENASLGDHPWIAALGYRTSSSSENTEWFCGGALITSRYVLTAAHCIKGTHPWKLYKVRLGAISLNNNVETTPQPVDILIEKTVVHEKFVDMKPKVENDIALIRLQQKVSYNQYIRPVCLPFSSQFRARSLTNEMAYIAGWGTTSDGGLSSTTLQHVKLPIVNLADCKKAYRPLNATVDHRNICAGYRQGGKDSCQGDSGGSLVWRNSADAKYYTVGVVSYGRRCAQKGFPGVYSEVSEFIDFIANNIEN